MINGGEASLIMTALVGAAFLLDWLAITFNWIRVKPLSKPLAMSLVIIWTLNAVGPEIGLLVFVLISAQVFGLAGDIFMLFPQGWFLWGLAAFLLGHLFYLALIGMIVFDHISKRMVGPISAWVVFSSIGLWVLIMSAFYWVFRVEVNPLRSARRLWAASQVYAFVLSGLMVAAFLLVIHLPDERGLQWLLPIGGGLFLLSDFLLAYDRFINRIHQGQLWVRITYHLAQFSLAWGFLSMMV